MNALKSAVLPLCLSLGVHAGVIWSLAQGPVFNRVPGDEPIEISYVELPLKKAPQAPSTPPAAVPKKKLRGIPIPRFAPAEAPEPSEPSDFQKDMEARLKKQRTILAKLSAAEPVEARIAPPKTGVEMLADPKKGKIYLSYFGQMKKKIQKTLLERFARRTSGKGNVTLLFVVNSEGFLEKVSISPKDAREDEMLRDMAVQCLQEAAPFGAFPPDLGSDRLAFTVTFLFDGR